MAGSSFTLAVLQVGVGVLHSRGLARLVVLSKTAQTRMRTPGRLSPATPKQQPGSLPSGKDPAYWRKRGSAPRQEHYAGGGVRSVTGAVRSGGSTRSLSSSRAAVPGNAALATSLTPVTTLRRISRTLLTAVVPKPPTASAALLATALAVSTALPPVSFVASTTPSKVRFATISVSPPTAEVAFTAALAVSLAAEMSPRPRRTRQELRLSQRSWW